MKGESFVNQVPSGGYKVLHNFPCRLCTIVMKQRICLGYIARELRVVFIQDLLDSAHEGMLVRGKMNYVFKD